MNAAVIFKVFDDSLNGKTRTRDVPAHGIARRQNIAVGQVQSGHVIMHLRGIHGATDTFQGAAHLLGDLIDPVRQDLESHRIDAGDDGIQNHGYAPILILIFRYSSMAARSPGFATTVVTGVSMIAGPLNSIPGRMLVKSYTRVGTKFLFSSK